MRKMKGKKKQNKNKGVYLLILLLVIILMIYITSLSTTPKPYLYIKLVNTSNQTYTLDNFKGHPIFMEYFATWCPHCKNMLPIMRELYNEYGSSIVFISISQEDIPILEQYVKDNNITWLVLHDNGTLANSLNINGVPTFIFIDKNGNIVKKIIGETSIDELRNALNSLLQ